MALILVLMCAGAFSSCSHPVAPAPADSVSISGIESGFKNVSYTFHATINFSSQATLIYKWTVDDSVISGFADSISWKFLDTGSNQISISVIQTGTNKTLCSSFDTILISDTTHHDTVKTNPSDTTSHNFVWTEYDNVNGENDMTGCCVFGSNDIYALNQYLYHFDGTSWSRASLNGQAPGALSGASIFGFKNTDFWLIDGSIIYHWNGSHVIETRLENTGVWHYPSDGTIHSAWGTSSNDMYFVGDSGTILHFDGSKWAKMSSGTTGSIGEISGTSDKNIWADGFNPQTGTTVILHYDGNSWSVIDPETISNFSPSGDWIGGTWAINSNNSNVVYLCGTQIWHSINGSPWVSDSGKVLNSSGTQYAFYMGGNSAADVMVASDGGLLSHWNGSSWHRYESLYSPGDASYATHAFSMKGNTACAVGWKGGTSWIAIGQR